MKRPLLFSNPASEVLFQPFAHTWQMMQRLSNFPFKALMVLFAIFPLALTLQGQGASAAAIDASTPAPFCPGASVRVNFNFVGWTTSTSVNLQLSDAAGNFPGTNIGSITAGGAASPGFITGTIPVNTAGSALYRLRVNPNMPNGNDNTAAFTVLTRDFTSAFTFNNPSCIGDPVSALITLSPSCAFISGNDFVLELSDKNGNFATVGYPKLIDTETTQNGTTLSGVIPSVPSGTAYRLRVRSTNPAITKTSAAFEIRGGSLNVMEAAATKFCQGQRFTKAFAFSNEEVLIANNEYWIQLSNAAGSFASPTIIGRIRSQLFTGNIDYAIPYTQPGGAGYKIRVVANNGTLLGCEYGPYTIAGPRALAIVDNVAACLGDPATFTTASSVGGVSYQWKKICTAPGSVFTHSGAGLDPMGSVANNVFFANSRLYVATPKGLGVSTTAAATAFTLFLGGNPINDVFADGSRIYLATPTGVRVSATLDGSGAFSNVDLLSGNPVSAVYASGTTVYAAGADGLYRSTELGG